MAFAPAHENSILRWSGLAVSSIDQSLDSDRSFLTDIEYIDTVLNRIDETVLQINDQQ